MGDNIYVRRQEVQTLQYCICDFLSSPFSSSACAGIIQLKIADDFHIGLG
jgi:hypothetical protein